MRAPLLVLLACAALPGCGDDGGPTFSPLTAGDGQFRDEQGRVVLLRGINARVDGVFDVGFDDDRLPNEEVPPLAAEDCRQMRALGFNTLRLPINWSGVEPERDVISEVYLQRVDAAIACAAEAGLYVIVDLHQDAYSKHIGEDGAPLWAIEPEPEMLLGGPLSAAELMRRRLSMQVQAAFSSFFDPSDAKGLQAEFRAMLAVVAARYAEHPMVLGFELFNEPQAAASELRVFDVAAAEAVRQAAPHKLVFFEPPVYRNFTDSQPLANAPFPVPGAVYSPHVYTFVFAAPAGALENLSKEDLRPSVENARAEAEAWGTPLFIGEFGVGPDTTNADLWMALQSELHSEYLASNAFWLWKEDSQGKWGLFDRVEDAWVLRPRVVAWVSRTHAERIAGQVIALDYDAAADRLRLETSGSGEHVIYVPQRAEPGFTAVCNGQQLDAARDSATGLIEVSCSGVLEVTGAAGDS